MARMRAGVRALAGSRQAGPAADATVRGGAYSSRTR